MGEGAMNTGQRRGEGQVEYWKLALLRRGPAPETSPCKLQSKAVV